MSKEALHICHCGRLTKINIPDTLEELRNDIFSESIDKLGIEFNDFITISNNGINKVQAVLDFMSAENLTVDDKPTLLIELRWATPEGDIDIKSYTNDVNRVIDLFAESILENFPNKEIVFLKSTPSKNSTKFYIGLTDILEEVKDEEGNFQEYVPKDVDMLIPYYLSRLIIDCKLDIIYIVKD